jgi:hypothetical protein
MIRNILIILVGTFLIQAHIYSQELKDEGSGENIGSEREVKREMDQLTSKILEIESKIDDLNKESVKERDIRWKVCLDDYLTTIKGVAASAVTAQTRLSDLIAAGKKEEAYGQLILLRGLSESAEKSMNDSLSCERQLTRVSSDTEIIVEINEEKTGIVNKDGVSDAMGVGFSDEFVADGDKSVASGSGKADAAGVESSDVPGDSPETMGGPSRSEQESVDIIDVPENNEASPTR